MIKLFNLSKVSKKRLKIVRSIIFSIVVTMLIGSILLLFIEEVDKKKNRLLFTIFQFVIMLLIMAIPQKLKDKWDFVIPVSLEVSFLLFAFGSFILGEVFNFYDKIPIWDAILHVVSGIVLAYLGLVLIKYFVHNENIGIQLSPMFIIIAVILFSLSLGAIWEISEFIADDWFSMNSQQYMATTGGTITTSKDVPLVGHEALRDTMEDLMLDLGGACFVGIIEYGNVKHRFTRKKKSSK